MKREAISKVLGNIRSEYIQEAIDYRPAQQKGGRRVQKKRISFPWKTLTALAACFALVTGLFFWTGKDNSFVVKAYAMEVEEDYHVILKEEDILSEQKNWAAYQQGNRIYLNTGFRYQGVNLKSVTFSTEEGSFALQHVPKTARPDDGVPKTYVNGDTLAFYGDEFEDLDSSFTLEGEQMEEDLLILWCIEAISPSDLPLNPRFTAKATFKNGQTKTIELQMERHGFLASGGREVDIERRQFQSEYYQSIPLNQCELVEEGTFTNQYHFTIDGYPFAGDMEHLVFDENGDYRMGTYNISGHLYQIIFHKNEDSTCTWRVYRFPDECKLTPDNYAEKKRELEGTKEYQFRRFQKTYYDSIPLEAYALIEEETFTDQYSFTIDGHPFAGDMKHHIFDEKGNLSLGRFSISGHTYQIVFRKNEDGTYTWQVYRLPDEYELTIDNFEDKKQEFAEKENFDEKQ